MANGDSPAGGLLDADRFLALSYAPAQHRHALRALWELDASLGAMLAGGNQPLVIQMKLAWWREALAGLDRGNTPAEPLLVRVSETILPAGITGEALSEVTEGWEYLLTPDPLTHEEAQAFARLRGATLFALSARILGASDPSTEAGGAAWALADLARRSSREEDIRLALQAAAAHLNPAPRLPRKLLPLGMLGMLAARDAKRGAADLEPRGSPGRMIRMLAYRTFGR